MSKVKTDQDWEIINEYESKRETLRRQQNERIKQIKDLVAQEVFANLQYITYAKAQGWFALTAEESLRTSLLNAIVSFNGHLIEWEGGLACDLSWRILEEVNLHKLCAKVRDLVGGK